MSVGLATALLGLTSLALAILLLPLLLHRAASPERDAYNLAVYRDQLAEVERELGRGLLSPPEAVAARTEIGRRILTLHPDEVKAAGAGRGAVAGIAAVLALPLVAWALYSQLGAPQLPDQPFAARHNAGAAVAGAPHIDLDQAVKQLAAHLADHQGDLTGWLLLARTDMDLSRYAAAGEAYRHAAALSGQRADILGEWGEAQVLAANGTVTPAAREAFTAALKDPEGAPRSRYYLALAQMQHGDLKGALAAWQALAADSPADAAWLPVVRQRIAEAAGKLGIASAGLQTGPAAAGAAPAGMPSQQAVAAVAKATAEAPPEARQAMIDAMVARLAARLEHEPNDVAGWAQLGRSYMVLHQPEKARNAFAHALKLRPEDAAIKAALAEAEATAGSDKPDK